MAIVLSTGDIGACQGQAAVGQDHPYYVLVESLGANAGPDSQRFVAALELALEANLISDAAVAKSENDRRAFWALRDDVAQVVVGGMPVVFDISLPINAMEQYVAILSQDLLSAIGDHKLWIFGHLGDGNLRHRAGAAQGLPGVTPEDRSRGLRSARQARRLYLGRAWHWTQKKPYLSVCRSDNEIAVMRRLKTALDPTGIL